MADDPVEVALRLHRALAAGRHGDELRGLFTEDCVSVEHPNLIAPTGSVTDLEDMIAGSERGAGLLIAQSFELVAADVSTGSPDTAILRSRWTGTIAAEVGPFRAGQQLVAHLAQFVTARGGRVSRIETFDCYEPFS